MCNQSVGLIASVIETGIPTVGLSLLREVTEKVKPPRTLVVPFDFGYPLGEPNQPELQHKIIAGALAMLQQVPDGPIISDYAVSA